MPTRLPLYMSVALAIVGLSSLVAAQLSAPSAVVAGPQRWEYAAFYVFDISFHEPSGTTKGRTVEELCEKLGATPAKAEPSPTVQLVNVVAGRGWELVPGGNGNAHDLGVWFRRPTRVGAQPASRPVE